MPHRCRPGVTLLLNLAIALALGCGHTETHPGVTATGGASSATEPTGDAGAAGTPSTNDALVAAGVVARKAGACTTKADLAAPLLELGTFDRLFALSYNAAILISSKLSERVVLRSVDVQLTDTTNNALHEPYSLNVTGFVEATNDATPSASVVSAELIPQAIASALPSGKLLAKVRVAGQTMSGAMLASPELVFPIEVCDGCLVQYPDSARDPAATGSQYQCRLTPDPVTDPEPCLLGIDSPFSCALCAATSAVCLNPANNRSH